MNKNRLLVDKLIDKLCTLTFVKNADPWIRPKGSSGYSLLNDHDLAIGLRLITENGYRIYGVYLNTYDILDSIYSRCPELLYQMKHSTTGDHPNNYPYRKIIEDYVKRKTSIR